MHSIVKIAAGAFVNRLPLVAVRVIASVLSGVRQHRAAQFVATRKGLEGISEIKLRNGRGVRLANDGSNISRLAYFFGTAGYEQYEVEVWRCLCSRSTSIVEIGGNIGYFTALGASASPHARYRVFEPHPHSVRSLLENVRINALRVEVSEQAVVGDPAITEITLHVPVEETGRQATGAYVDHAEGIDRPSVESFRVSALYSGLIRDFDLLKLDVEGAEYQILLGMRDELLRSRPVIMVEVRRRTPRLREWLVGFAQEARYEVRALSSPMRTISPDELRTVALQDVYGTRDVVLVPRERLAILPVTSPPA